ncbi:mannose-1-phosphate guanylyltransferase [Halosegnis marinus]|uniref:Mannose-1-phosphate guanylyltransferase n=1 Tax=Halosegnis marinus TaxID=3034023 RepID=A0ABD5ZPU2_9EURY|nr:sugar phosphate nucleotidyltransferase [Halosegnis sp. DT85]
MTETVAVVLAGGRGTRLYPASTATTPKQFRTFGGERSDGARSSSDASDGGDESLLARTVARADAVADAVYVLTRPAYADRIGDHAPDAEVLVEPEPRDTGPAMLYAARELAGRHDDPVLVNLPSDHHMGDGYAAALSRAAGVARDTGGLVTLGVTPTRAATGYGYIEPGERHGDYAAVASFTEKPDAETAARFREQGYLWNAGVFAWTPAALFAAARDAGLGEFLDALDRDPAAAFAGVGSVSIDYAVMESAGDAFVLPADFAWDDLGAWDAFERVLDGDGAGNVSLGETLAVDCENCVLAAGADDHVAAVGVSDLAVATYDGRTVVVPKGEAERVRDVVDALD